MKREDLDHLLRAAGDVTGHKQFVLVGSNAIFAWSQVVPESMAISREIDLFASGVSDEDVERLSDLLENIGHLSQFDDTHGYHVDGVGPRTAVLPTDWRARSKTYTSGSTNGVTAIVPHPEDIALSKLCAGREKDIEWVCAADKAGFIDLERVATRIALLVDRTDAQRDHIAKLIHALRDRS